MKWTLFRWTVVYLIVMLRGLLLQKKYPRRLVAVKNMALLCTSLEEYWDAV
jgi:hypothetical protein